MIIAGIFLTYRVYSVAIYKTEKIMLTFVLPLKSIKILTNFANEKKFIIFKNKTPHLTQIPAIPGENARFIS